MENAPFGYYCFFSSSRAAEKIAIALVKGLHGVKQLVSYLAGELARQVAEFSGVVDIVIEHVLQQGHGLFAG